MLLIVTRELNKCENFSHEMDEGSIVPHRRICNDGNSPRRNFAEKKSLTARSEDFRKTPGLPLHMHKLLSASECASSDLRVHVDFVSTDD